MSLAKPYEQGTGFSAWRLRKLVVDFGVYMALAVLLIAAVFLTPKLYEVNTIAVVMRQASQLGIVAIGQTMILLVAGLDLSVGGIFIMTSIVVADVTNGRDEMVLPAILISLGIGALIGAGNGILVTKRRVPPFVATLGMLVLVKGATQAYTKGVPGGFVPEIMGIVNQSWFVLSIPLLLWLGLNAFFIFVLRRTAYGRKVYAVGSNTEAARLSGISVDAIRISVYILGSCLAVVSGVVLTGYVGYVDRFIGTGLELDSIAAAIVGGTAFVGGRGGLMGTIAGVLMIQILSTMAVLMGLDIEVQFIIKGLVILGAVTLYSVASIEE
ncbi:MAG: ABC transporter permease [Chloroflexota bacterium]|nr:ABC transporter permease [Chloroflexota bacterium]MDE2952458.1 ABC transporter permease [Chloroflexota bacterium]